MADKYYLEEIEFNSKRAVKRKKQLLSELDELEDSSVSLPSSIYSKTKKEKKEEKERDKKKKEDDNSSEDIDDWMTTINSFKAPKIKKKNKSLFDAFDYADKKGKKKKGKSKKGELVNHKKEFEPEMMLLRNLQLQQSKFVDSLQKKYDQFENTKSTARGVGKFTTDLINSITSARSVSLQLIDKIISTKKTIADLDFKERKEFGSNSNSEQTNLNNYASTYLKQMMTVGRNNVVGQPEAYNVPSDNDDDYDDLFSSIDESLGDTGRSEDVEKYLKYENDNIEVKVIWYDNAPDDDITKKYDYVAYDQKGNIIDDYPLPEKTKMNINKSTGTAIDLYGNKYHLIIQ